MVKLGEKSICLLCKQVACVEMSPAEDGMEEMSVFVPGCQNWGCSSVPGFARKPRLLSLSFFPLAVLPSPAVLAPAARASSPSLSQALLSLASPLSGRVSVLVSFQNQLSAKLLGH